MNKKNVWTCLMVLALAVAGCLTAVAAEPAEKAPSPQVAQPADTFMEKAKKLEYFPLIPKVNWEELNWLQKTTASIAIVPGCVLSALANTCIWIVR